jgi:hypothetical protein
MNQAQRDYVKRVVASNPHLLVVCHKKPHGHVIVEALERRASRRVTVGLILLGPDGKPIATERS